ncbi:MAG: EamA family transporter [Nitrososphaeraceae archaeon]
MHQLKIWLVLVSVWIILASTYPTIKIAVETIPPVLLVGIKGTFGGLMLLLIFKIYTFKIEKRENKQNIRHLLTRDHWKLLTIIAIFFVPGSQVLLAYGEQYLTSDFSVLVYSTIPIWTILLGIIFYGLRINKFTMLGIMIGTIGLVILIYPSLEELISGNQNTSVRFDLFGILAILIAAISWSSGSLFSKKAELPKSILLSSGMWLLIGGLISLVISIIIGELDNFELSQVSLNSFASLLYLATVAKVGLATYFWILRKTTATLANTFAYAAPAISVILSWAIFSEAIDLRMLIATIIILSGVIIIVNKDRIHTRRAANK